MKGGDLNGQSQYNKYIEGKLPANGVVKASGGKSSHMGSNRNMGQAQSRLSNNDGPIDADADDDDSSDEDNLHEEPPDMRVYPEFLKNLPGVQATDSMGYRIEALRVYLETQLGDQVFVGAYQHLANL
jgi:hypothetical protein